MDDVSSNCCVGIRPPLTCTCVRIPSGSESGDDPLLPVAVVDVPFRSSGAAATVVISTSRFW